MSTQPQQQKTKQSPHPQTTHETGQPRHQAIVERVRHLLCGNHRCQGHSITKRLSHRHLRATIDDV